MCAGLVQPRDKTMPPSPSALRRKNDAEYHTFIRAYLPRGADMCATSGATTLLIVSLGTGVHSPSTLTS